MLEFVRVMLVWKFILNMFLFLLFTLLEEFICNEHAVVQAFRDTEQDCSHSYRYNCDAGHGKFLLGQSNRTWRKAEEYAELRTGSMRNRGEEEKRNLL